MVDTLLKWFGSMTKSKKSSLKSSLKKLKLHIGKILSKVRLPKFL
jgi:hypothetical protein